ncbi:DUF4369 domain-containing protein [Puteibacter caeruleilacunae]|nr:DUF4369 domain-containing protein [Puteibacter caeruleilacunae]
MKLVSVIIGLLILSSVDCLAYQIKGKLDLSSKWQNVLYLSSVDGFKNLFIKSPDYIINSATIDKDGSFEFTGNDLPEDGRFYRIHIERDPNGLTDFLAPSEKNQCFVVLDSNTEMTLTSNGISGDLSELKIEGSETSRMLYEIENEIHSRKAKLSSDLPKAKYDLVFHSLLKYIKDKAMNVDDPYVSLFAIAHIDDKNSDFLNDSDFYLDFQTQLQNKISSSSYYIEYNEMLKELVQYRNTVCKIPDSQYRFRGTIVWAELGLIICLIIALIVVYRKYQLAIAGNVGNNPSQGKTEETKKLLKELTSKELDILRSIAAGKTNKEIALEFHIELSTVKSHINNIYKRLKVAGRKEAVEMYESGN